MNFISTIRLCCNSISIYSLAGQSAKLFFNRTIFAYADNVSVREQFILRQSKEQLVFKITKSTMDLKIWHGWLVYLSYQNVFANAKKIINMERVQRLILMKLCKSCMTRHQKLEISWTLMPKAAEILGRFYADIKEPLLVTFLSF